MRAPDVTHIKIKHGRCSTCGHHGDDCTGSEYPEHDRLRSIKEYSEQIGAFIEWMQKDGIAFTRRHKHTKKCGKISKLGYGYLCQLEADSEMPYYERIEKMLARYFEIDLNKIETEKREMLASLRLTHETKRIRQELALRD